MSHFHNVVIILEKSWQDEARRSSVSEKNKEFHEFAEDYHHCLLGHLD